MKDPRIGLSVVLATSMLCSVARANIEPSAYDAKSIGAGTTGMAYLDNPSALALNPANLAQIKGGAFSVNLTAVFAQSEAPLSGANTVVKSDLGFGPIPSIFGAARVSKRVVLGFGAYSLGVFGAKYSDVMDLYGQPGVDGDFEVTFISGEAAVAAAFQVLTSLDLAVALRVPFARQDATIPVTLGATTFPVTATLGGAGPPGVRVGATWRATPMVAASLMYRSQVTNRLSGDLETLSGPDLNSGVTARFSTPHVLSGGTAFSLLNRHLTVAAELHILFYKASNQKQTLTLEDPPLPGLDTADILFLWQNAYSLRFGADYQITPRFAVRAGYVPSSSSTTAAGAQPVTPPPGWSHSFSAGFGANWKNFAVDFALQTAFASASVGPNSDGTPCPTNDAAFDFLRVGCEGEYKTVNYSASLQFVYKR